MRIKFLITTILISILAFSAYAQTLQPQQNKKGEYGYVDVNGKWIVKAQYTEAGQFAGNYAVVKKKDKYGLIDLYGNETLKPKYKYIIPLNDVSAWIFCNSTDNSESEYFDFVNGLSFKISDHKIEAMQDWYSLNSFGYAYSSKINKEYIYKYLRSIFNYHWRSVPRTHRILNINLKKPYKVNGKTITNMSFTSCRFNFQGEYNAPWTISHDGRSIFIVDYKDEETFNKPYRTKYFIHDGELIGVGNLVKIFGNYYEKHSVSTNSGNKINYYKDLHSGKYFLFDENNEDTSSSYMRSYDNHYDKSNIGYDSIVVIEEDHLLLKQNGTWSIKYMRQGQQEYVFKNPGGSKPYISCYITGMHGSQCIIKDNGKYGLFVHRLYLPCEYDSIKCLRDNIYMLKKDGKTQLFSMYDSSKESLNIMDLNNRYEVTSVTDYLDEIIVQDKVTKKQGFLKDGKVIIPVVKDSIDIVETFGLDHYIYAYYDKGIKYVFNEDTGKLLLSGNNYDAFAPAFQCGAFIVYKGDKVGLVNAKTGKVIAPAIYDGFFRAGNGHYVMRNKYGTKHTLVIYDSNGIKKASQVFVDDGSYYLLRKAVAFLTSWCGTLSYDPTGPRDKVYLK